MQLKRALTSLTHLMKGNTKQRECYPIITLLTTAICLMSVSSILTGCYQPQPQIITKKVYIPTKCIATIPPPPHLPSDVVKGVILLQRSYLELRLILTECACSSAQCTQGDQNAKK